MPSARTGSPRAPATASSRLANSSGRAISTMPAQHSPIPIAAAGDRLRAPEPEDRAEQHVDVGRAVPRASRRRVDAEEQHAEPSIHGEHGADDDVVGGARAARAAPITDRDQRPSPTNSPTRASTPTASAASAPVNATWLSASALNTWLRSTTK